MTNYSKKEKRRRAIHHHLKKHIPQAYHRSKRIFKIKYPKLILLCISIAVTYYLFTQPIVTNLISNLGKLSYLSSFISGILISFGFSAPLGIGFFLSSHSGNFLLIAIIGGVGATVGDLVIFRIIKFSFMDEFEKIEKINLIQKIREIVYQHKPLVVKHYLIYTFAGILIATPLPDEIGVSMLAGLTTINAKKLAVLAFIIHTLAILGMLYLGKAIL